MSRVVFVSGIEAGDLSSFENFGAAVVSSGQRTGSYALRANITSAVNGGVQLNQGLFQPGAGDRFDFRVRPFFKFDTLPSANNLMVAAILDSVQGMALEISTTGQLRITTNGTSLSYSGAVIVTGRWYRADVRMFGLWHDNPGTFADTGRKRVTVDVYDYGTDGLLQPPVLVYSAFYPTADRSGATVAGTNSGFYVNQSITSCREVEANLANPSTYFQRITGVTPSAANADYGQPPPAVFNSANQIRGPAETAGPVTAQGTAVEFGALLGLELHDFEIRHSFGSLTTVTIGQDASGVSCTRDIYYDDILIDWRSGADADALEDWPLGTRVHAFVPTGPGAFDTYAGDFTAVDDLPSNGTLFGSDHMSSNSANEIQTFVHAALANPTDLVYAITVKSNCGATGGNPHFLRLGSDELSGSFTPGTHDQSNKFTPWLGKSHAAAPLSNAAWVALEFGWRSGSSGLIHFVNIWLEALSGPNPAEVTFTNGGTTIGLTWVERTDSAAIVHVSAKIALPDPLIYFFGFKKATIISWGQIRRALSDRNGQYEGTDFSWVESDTDRFIRGQLGAESTRYFVNQPFTVRMIGDAERRLQLTPRTVVKGIIRTYRPLSPLHFEFGGRDILAAKFDPQNTEDQLPQRVIEIADFPDCPENNRGLGVPIIYGDLTGERLVEVIVPGEPIPPGLPPSQVLPLDNTIDAPTGQGASDLRIRNGNLDGRLYYAIYAVKNGKAGQLSAKFSTVDYKRGVWINWNQVPGVDSYRVNIWDKESTYNPRTNTGPAPNHARFVTHDNVTFDGREPPHSGWEKKDFGVIFRNWTEGTNLRATATGGGGTTDPHVEIQDQGRGVVPVVHVGTEVFSGFTWQKFLVCGHAVKSIDGWYLNGGRKENESAAVGGDWVIPGQPNWDNHFGGGAPKYKDINGHRYTLIYVKGDDGSVAIGESPAASGSTPQVSGSNFKDQTGITLNVKGIESVGDTTGTLISSLPLQYLHTVVNWLLGNYQTGAWLPTPVFPDDPELTQIDEASFTLADTVANERIAGGYVGAFIIGSDGERVGVRDQIARFNVNCDVDSGFNRKTQFMISMASESISQVLNAGKLTDQLDIFAGSFDIEDIVDDLFNYYEYRYARQYAPAENVPEWVTPAPVKDDLSITKYKETKKAPILDLEMIRASAIALDVTFRKLLRTKTPPRHAKLQTGLAGFNYELGQILKIDHYQGISGTGWTDRPVRIMRHDADPNEFTVTIEAFDMGFLFGTVDGGGGSFILGDEGTLPASWPSTTPAQKIYGFLADETTGFFSNSLEGKHLR